MLYLISYDVQNDKERNRICKYLKNLGYHLQKSVFLCDLEEKEATLAYKQILSLRKSEEDRIFLVPLCQQCFAKKMLSGKYPKVEDPIWIA